MDIKYSTLSETELVTIINSAEIELQKRKKEKENKLIEAFEKAWRDLEEGGIKIWFSGNEYTVEEDFQLKLNEVYFDSEP